MSLLITEGLGAEEGGGGILPLELRMLAAEHRISLTVDTELQLVPLASVGGTVVMDLDAEYTADVTVQGFAMDLTYCKMVD